MKEIQAVRDAALAEKTVNDVIRDHPESVAVFSRHGIDSCCGGALPVREAAGHHDVPLDELLEELRGAIDS
jgi:regulator of cell morphogenesis and NO signaling